MAVVLERSSKVRDSEAKGKIEAVSYDVLKALADTHPVANPAAERAKIDAYQQLANHALQVGEYKVFGATIKVLKTDEWSAEGQTRVNALLTGLSEQANANVSVPP